MLGRQETAATFRMQRTLRNTIGCVGIGLRTGAKVSLALHPAEVGSGIRFVRYDQAEARPIPARFDQVCATVEGVTLGDPGGPVVASIEHLMAALAICEIDNVLVEVGGPEVPVMDGSAAPFVFLLECAGVIEQDRPACCIEVLRRIEVGEHGGSACLEPAERLELCCEIVRQEAPVSSRGLCLPFDPDRFKNDIAAARDPGAAAGRGRLWSTALPHGVAGMGRANGQGVAAGDCADEALCHELLDSLSDLNLCGGRLIGRFTARAADHSLRLRLLRTFFADPTAWRIVDDDLPADREPPRRRAVGA